ncbi:hypothetical protein [Arthrobacter sp. 92]|uniref:hypothetical protein n=1 Tax=Arthrobacter sp. 92 TaxID=3418175 RepID=UPI003D01A6F8
MTGGSALSASASDTVATVVVPSGSLELGSGTTAVVLGTVTPGTSTMTALPGLTVKDNRAGTAGWTASVVVTDFTGRATGTSLSAAGATYAPLQASTAGTATVTPSSATDLRAPKVVQTATGVSGNNSATWTASLIVSVPPDTIADTYNATLTYSLS